MKFSERELHKEELIAHRRLIKFRPYYKDIML